MDLATKLAALRTDLERRQGRKEAVEESIRREDARAEKFDRDAALHEKVIQVVQAAQEARREELRDRVESIVTRGLRAVFGRADMEFFFRTTFDRGVFCVQPMVRTKFGERDLEVDVVEGHGGGVADVVSFLLRVVVLCLARPRVAPLLVLDESFRHVSQEHLGACSVLMKELNRSAGIQFLLVTHKPELTDAADVIYRVENLEGQSIFHLEHDLRDEVYHARPQRDARGRERTTAFDGEGLLPPERQQVEPGATPVLSETTDVIARRARHREELKHMRPYRPRKRRESTPEDDAAAE